MMRSPAPGRHRTLDRLLSMSRRRRAFAAGATALLCMVIPAAAAQSAGASTPRPAPSVLNSVHKFSADVQKVAAGTTGVERARIAASLDLPVQSGAYNVEPLWKKGVTGKGVGIATIVSFGDPDAQAYIDQWDKTYGLPKTKITTLEPDGDASCPPGEESVCANWAGETDLDISMMHSIAPGAHIYIVATPVAETEGIHGFPEMMKAIDYLIAHKTVQVISMSLGATEQTFKSPAQLKSLDPTLLRAQKAGIPVVAASGDEGATGYRLGGKHTYRHRVVGFPASDPLVTAVGGTVLHISGGHRTEPDSLISFSGGGSSSVYPRPSWQNGVAGITKSKMRSMPDVSMEGVEGTSMAAPLFGGILALATQENNGKPLGYLNPTLYKMGPQGKKVGLVDVTSGNNTYDGVTGYDCAKGFDVPSGWGTINGATFVPDLVAALKSS
jgi:subtilase family serine protease